MDHQKWIDPFVGHLQQLAQRDDRAALAKLRRGLGREPGEVVEALPLVVPWIPDSPAGRWAFVVAPLFALHPSHADAGDFGRSFRLLGDEESFEKRFSALLNSHEDELPARLRQAVALMKSKDVRIDFRRLLRDLTGWSHESRFVQLRWARSYWGRPTENDPSSDSN